MNATNILNHRKALSAWILTLCAASFTTASVYAQTAWEGPGDNWIDDSNWSNGRPSAADDVFIGAGAGLPVYIHTLDPMYTPGADDVLIGFDGTQPSDGTLSIYSGATLTSASGTLGYSTGAATGFGGVVVGGAGSAWNMSSGTLVVGESYSAYLQINSGGSTLSSEGSIGLYENGIGQVNVQGSGSQWSVTNLLRIGDAGQGFMQMELGGVVNAGSATVGLGSNAAGEVVVKGAGSKWTLTNSLTVGRSGIGILTITDSGQVEVLSAPNSVTLAEYAGTGTLNIGAAESDAAASPGTLSATRIAFGAGDGKLVFNHTGAGYTFASEFSGNGSVIHKAGETFYTGLSTTFLGETTVAGGTLYVNGNLSSTTVVNGGTLGGQGLFADVTGSGGTLAPGNSPGTMTISGDLTLDAATTLDFELGDPLGTAGTDSDLINVGGNLTLDGTVRIIDLGAYGAGTYRLLNYTGTLTDNSLTVGTQPAGFVAVVDTATQGQVNLIVSNDSPPTPGTSPKNIPIFGVFGLGLLSFLVSVAGFSALREKEQSIQRTKP